MDDLRDAVDQMLPPTGATRLVTIDAGDLVAAGGEAVRLALATRRTPGTALVDPLRLPLVGGIVDIIVARDDFAGADGRRLRELWRILGPAGVVVLIIPLPPRWSLKGLMTRYYRRGRVKGMLAAAMFDVERLAVLRAAIVVRAVKSDGLAPQPRGSGSPVRRATA